MIDVGEGLDPHLHLSRVIENTTVAVHEVLNDGKVIVCRRIAEDSLVPVLEVRILGDEVRKSRPLVGRGDQAGSVSANLSDGRICGLEGI